MQALGYSLNMQGICHGFVMMWVQALLSGEELKFFHRVGLICSTSNLVEAIQLVKQKIIENQPITSSDQEILDISAFFDGVALYHEPYNYKDVFGKSVSQFDVLAITSFTASDLIEKQQGIVEVYSEPEIDDIPGLQQYFNRLRTKIKLNAHPERLPIVLAGSDHTIGLRYDKKNDTWVMIDANQLWWLSQMNQLAIPYEFSCKSVASNIVSALGGAQSTAFNASIYTTGNDPDYAKIKSTLSELKKTNSLKRVVAFRTGKLGETFSAIAARHGHLDLFEESAEHKVDINKANVLGNSPIHMAILSNHIDLVLSLVKRSADLNKANNEGNTPMHLAAAYGYLQIVKILADQQVVDLHKTNKNGHSPADVAIYNHYAEVIEVLAKHQVNFNIKNQFNFSPLINAMDRNEWKMVLYMLLSMRNIQQIDPPAITRLMSNRAALAKELMLYIEKLDVAERRQIAVDVIQEDNALGVLFNLKMDLLTKKPYHTTTKILDDVYKELKEIVKKEIVRQEKKSHRK